jgi:hypothetical protein
MRTTDKAPARVRTCQGRWREEVDERDGVESLILKVSGGEVKVDGNGVGSVRNCRELKGSAIQDGLFIRYQLGQMVPAYFIFK